MDKTAAQAQGRGVADYFDPSNKGGLMKKRVLSIFTTWSLLVALAGLLTAPSATAQGFTVTDLGTLGGINSQATAINNRGQVVGFSTLQGEAITRAFLWEDGVITDLGSLGGTFSKANAINNRGQVVGASEITANAARHAVLFDRHGITDLGAFPGSLVGAAFGINNRGDIFGGSTTEGSSRSGPFHAAQFKDGGGTDLGTLGGPTSFAAGVNNHGQAVGKSRPPRGSLSRRHLQRRWDHRPRNPPGRYDERRESHQQSRRCGLPV
jgi:probable HAF family extracellular repeat protein